MLWLVTGEEQQLPLAHRGGMVGCWSRMACIALSGVETTRGGSRFYNTAPMVLMEKSRRHSSAVAKDFLAESVLSTRHVFLTQVTLLLPEERLEIFTACGTLQIRRDLDESRQ